VSCQSGLETDACAAGLTAVEITIGFIYDQRDSRGRGQIEKRLHQAFGGYSTPPGLFGVTKAKWRGVRSVMSEAA